jgi:hypothetical protein
MKKQILFLVISLYLFGSSSAQPVLTASGITPVIGDHFVRKQSHYISPGNAGANQIWDLQKMETFITSESTILLPSTVYLGDTFGLANIVSTDFNSSISFFFKTTPAGIYYYGYSYLTQKAFMKYQDPEQRFRFPFAMNDAYSDSFSGEFMAGQNQFYRKGKITVTADGYGKLHLPGTQFSNVMRIHLVENYTDSSKATSPMFIKSDMYYWYKEGIHDPLAVVYIDSSQSWSPISGGSFITGFTGINEQTDLSASIQLFPNPASTKVNIRTTLKADQPVSVTVLTPDGREVIDRMISGTYGVNDNELDITGLPCGIYMVRIRTGKDIIADKRLVIAR